MRRLIRILIAVLLFVSPFGLVRAEETDDAPKKTIEFPSPDGRFAFRYGGSTAEDEKQTYVLIEKASRKVVKTVASLIPTWARARVSPWNKCCGDPTQKHSP